MTRPLPYLLLLLLLTACAAPISVPPATTAAVAEATATAPPAATQPPATAAPAPPVVAAPLPTLSPAPILPALTEALQSVATGALGGGDVGIIYLDARQDGTGRWLAHTSGLLSGDPPQPHRLLLYTYDGASWIAEDEAALDFVGYLFPDSVTVTGDGAAAWLELQAGVGAHSSCFVLLRVAGTALMPQISHCHSSFASAGVADLDGDGLPYELLLNQSDDYVFCYACGVRRPDLALLTWDGAQWVAREPAPLPAGAPEALAAANQQALALAAAGLWQEAAAALADLATADETLRWNSLLLELQLAARRDALEGSPYPLLNHVYLGDYAGALDLLRPYPPAQLFAADTPVIAGTAADGFGDVVAAEILTVSEKALALQPERAAAHFLRAWALYLADPANPRPAEAALERADALAPGDPLIADSLFFFYNDVRYRP